MKQTARRKGRLYRSSSVVDPRRLGARPPLPKNIRFLASIRDLFSEKNLVAGATGHLSLPSCFSLIDNYEESFDFLKRLFSIIYQGKVQKVLIDYGLCERIDVDASICMDVILAEFSTYLNASWKANRQVFPKTIGPINIRKKEVLELLNSIGAYKNLRGVTIPHSEKIEPLPVLINNRENEDVWEKNEIHLTEIVEYIKRCLAHLGKDLNSDSETEFYKVIGEVMSNAEEHSTMPNRYAIGYFQEDQNENDEVFGVLNFSIFNFGDTIYETFKSKSCPNKRAVAEMTELSKEYTKKGWIKKAQFEEETLWTLYSLQDGVTSKAKKRGNGSIQFIKNFFKLKGDMEFDNVSKLAILSGNTRILFDGKYQIVEKKRQGIRTHQMITFNESEDISQQPDKNYVKFAPYFFPGTIISARILIKAKNLSNS